MRLTSAIPALPVRNVTSSATFYEGTLGFALIHREDGFAIFRRDDVELHLWQSADESWRTRDPGKPVQTGAESFIAGTASCRIAVSGIDDLHAELQPRGILHPNAPLASKPWGTREFAILDPDGNLLTFFERR